MANCDVRLALFSGTNFTGRRILFRRGGVAIRDLGAFRFNNELTSFRLRNVVNGTEVTLLLFSRNNFQGSFRVYRGNRNVANLAQNGFNNVTSSLIVVGRILTDSEIRQIRSTGTPPRDILVIRQ
ncbi:beta/gamma crystallin family protein [Paenibacillus agricola]|uniref:Beta/gamma crystallin family protein n=1 Tax=Paenibacillus agricola TaxID=2716264 RepID=A0ABX0J7D5_9BACL|nr:beta/gamma crystallin family protein [Paenibacillus agricola]NHN29979.1 beta/gamma crystallin family protein [Paenibacillus agricola]